ncbi:MAG: tetratricopeptide repeat protein [Terriglobales bacterium]
MPSTNEPISASQKLSPPSPKAQKLILSLLLVLATLALYNPVAHAPFLNLDDDIYITQNPEVRSGLNWHSTTWAFRTTTATNWHPLTWLSHELDCQLFGLNPAGPHLVNVFLHAANAALLFLILASATGMIWRSLMVAALFALHPINVESVAWIAERKNVLSMLLFFLALAAYGWYTRSSESRNQTIRRYLTVTVLYALALMAKPQVITFPFALLLLDYWPLGRIGTKPAHRGDAATSSYSAPHIAPLAECGIVRWQTLIREKIPWFALSAASAIVTMKAQSTAMHEGIPAWMHLANAALAYAKYIGKIFWPANLAPLYPHPGGAIDIPGAIISTIGILAITVVVVIFRERRYLFVGWFWFLGTMVPMVGLVQVGVQSMADRYAYIPALGIFVLVCWGIPDLLQSRRASNISVEARLASSLSPAKTQSAAALILIVPSIVILSSLALALHRQVNYWTDNQTLWQHTLDVTQKNFIAEDNVATALLAKGRTDEAIPFFREAQAIRPADPVSKLNIASYEQQHGNNRGAIQGYDEVMQLTGNPELLALAHSNRGYAYLALNEDDKAKQDFVAALAQQPENSAAYLGLGMLAKKSGDLMQAAHDFQRSAEIQPTPMAYQQLAEVLDAAGQKEAAQAARAQAAKITRP